jgi:hypothetical protein
MASVDFYIYIVIGLLGVSYPILLQVIARLDEKYSSEKIVELFDQEWESNAFPYSLYSTLAFIVLWSLKLPPLIKIDGMNYFIENSASIFVALNTILLVIFFFFLVKKIIIYYSITKLIPYLIQKHEEK